MSIRLRSAAVILFALLAPAAPLFAGPITTIDFEDLRTDSALAFSVGPTYSDGGFVLTSVPLVQGEHNEFDYFGTLSNEFYGSTAFLNCCGLNTTVLTCTDGGAFNLLSIDLIEIRGFNSDGTQSDFGPGHDLRRHEAQWIDSQLRCNVSAVPKGQRDRLRRVQQPAVGFVATGTGGVPRADASIRQHSCARCARARDAVSVWHRMRRSSRVSKTNTTKAGVCHGSAPYWRLDDTMTRCLFLVALAGASIKGRHFAVSHWDAARWHSAEPRSSALNHTVDRGSSMITVSDKQHRTQKTQMRSFAAVAAVLPISWPDDDSYCANVHDRRCATLYRLMPPQ